jgi:hypothetical protein
MINKYRLDDKYRLCFSVQCAASSCGMSRCLRQDAAHLIL